MRLCCKTAYLETFASWKGLQVNAPSWVGQWAAGTICEGVNNQQPSGFGQLRKRRVCSFSHPAIETPILRVRRVVLTRREMLGTRAKSRRRKERGNSRGAKLLASIYAPSLARHFFFTSLRKLTFSWHCFHSSTQAFLTSIHIPRNLLSPWTQLANFKARVRASWFLVSKGLGSAYLRGEMKAKYKVL